MAHRLPTTIASGEFRHRIQIAAPNGTQDPMGGVSQDPRYYDVVRTCWASIQAWTGDSRLATEQFMSSSSHWITIRFPRTAEINASMLVWFRQRTFQIDAVLNPTEEDKLMVLVCTEVNNSRQEVPTPEPSVE